MLFHSKIKRIFSCVWGLFLLFFLLLGTLVCLCLDQQEEVSIYTSVQVDEHGKAVGYVSLSEDLFGISGGDALAMLVTLEISEGWRMETVSCTHQDQEMQLTVSFSEENCRAAVLLDGYPSEILGDGCILTVELVREEDTHLPCRLTVSPGRYGKAAIYCRSERGEIRAVPLTFTLFVPSDTSDLSESPDPPNTETEPSDPLEADTETEREESSMQETPTSLPEETEREEAPPADTGQREPVTDPSEDPGEPLTRFVGCRETPVRDGAFAVQLLFCGEMAYTPVICFSGGDRITVEVVGTDLKGIGEGESFCGSLASDHLYACTFWELPAEGDTVFFVESNRKTLRVIYRNGIFMGFFE